MIYLSSTKNGMKKVKKFIGFKRLFQVSFFFLIFGLFFFRAQNFLDPDFGWHLKTGELILEKGIPYLDPFSYTMPNYKFIDHEWLTDVIIAKLYPVIGMSGLAYIFSFLNMATIFILVKKFPIKWFLIPALLTTVVFLSFAGIRSQIITWFFFSVLMRLVLEKNLWNKYCYLTPFLFLLWANLHGGFVMGIGLLVLNLVFNIGSSLFVIHNPFRNLLKTLKQVQIDILILFLSFLATLINPYGFNLWREIWVSISDSSLRFFIAEWIPSIFILNFIIWFYFSFSITLVFLYRTKFSILEKTLYSGLLIIGLTSIRNMPLWVIISLPITTKALILLSQEASKYTNGTARLKKGYLIFLLMVFVFIFSEIVSSFSAEKLLTEESFYPKKAIEFLKTKNIKGEIFSEYGWGGYLIWKMPSKKVFVDGRMPSWRQETENRNESRFAFGEYKDLLTGKAELEKTAVKYNIKIFLLPIKREEKKDFFNIAVRWEEKILKKEKKGKEIYQQLKEKGWKEVYKDKISIIYGLGEI